MERSTTLVRCAVAAALLASISLPSLAAVAPPMQPLEDIERRAADQLRELHGDATDASIEIRPLDRRLRLAQCDDALDAQLVGARAGRPVWGANVVEVSCPGAPGWRVRVRAQTTVEREVWTLARAVQRGERLTPDLLMRETVSLGDDAPRARRAAVRAGGAGPIDALEPLLGQVFKRALRAGSVPSSADLSAPVLVQRGRQVRLRREIAGMSVETQATALADGRRDERVSVRNERSGRRLDAVVVGVDSVVVR